MINREQNIGVENVAAGIGDMPKTTYDIQAVNEQLVGLTATQTMSNKTLTAPVVNSPTGIVKADVGLGNVDNTSDATKNSATATLENKEITARVQSVVSSATVTPVGTSDDLVDITAQAVNLTLANPSGSPTNGRAMIVRIKDNATTRTITYGTEYRALGVTLPASTTANKTIYLAMVYNSNDTKWDVIGVRELA